MKITVTLNELLAARLFTCDDDARYVLQGVFIEQAAGRKPLLVATNGWQLAIIETKMEQTDAAADEQVIISDRAIDILQAAVKNAGFGKTCNLTIETKGSMATFEIETVGRGTYSFSVPGGVVEGNYPNFRQLIPKKGKPFFGVGRFGVNLEAISLFDKAAQMLGQGVPGCILYFHGETDACYVLPHGEENGRSDSRKMDIRLFGIVMPQKASEKAPRPECPVPDWLLK